MKLKNEAAKLGIHIAIKPNKSICQRISDDRDRINPLETAGIYPINYSKEEGVTRAYIRKTKRKIKQCIAEHKRDIILNKETTALAKLNRKDDIEIDFTHIKKLSNYENHNYALK